MIGIAALWIIVLLLAGGFALDRVLTRTLEANFDSQLETILKGMIGAAEIGPDGEVRFSRPPADQRFVEPYSGLYFQISGAGADTFRIAIAYGTVGCGCRRCPCRRETASLRQQRILRFG